MIVNVSDDTKTVSVTEPQPIAVTITNESINIVLSDDSIDVSASADDSVTVAQDSRFVQQIGSTPYEGSYIVIPKTTAQVLDTEGKTMQQDLIVTGVPYYETHNATGETVYIANEVL